MSCITDLKGKIQFETIQVKLVWIFLRCKKLTSWNPLVIFHGNLRYFAVEFKRLSLSEVDFNIWKYYDMRVKNFQLKITKAYFETFTDFSI